MAKDSASRPAGRQTAGDGLLPNHRATSLQNMLKSRLLKNYAAAGARLDLILFYGP
jgi:hypothetical protein